MLKLYKRTPKSIKYWEAWKGLNSPFIVIHYGTVGKKGRNRQVKIPSNVPSDKFIAEQSEPLRADGYAEAAPEEHTQVVLQYRTVDFTATTDELDARHRVEDLLNECLGWTGNGHCDGGDAGSYTINAFCWVIDHKIAGETIVEALRAADLLDNATIAYRGKDDIYRVMWPTDRQEPFSLLGKG